MIPANHLKLGVDLSNAHHIHLVMQGKFKGENNVKHHMVAVASSCVSGINTRWWLEKLVVVRRSEGCDSGPVFGDAQGAVALSSAEAEFYAMIEAVLRSKGMLSTMIEMGYPCSGLITLHTDSSAAKSFVSRRGLGK